MHQQEADKELTEAAAEAKFKELFEAYYKPLHGYAYTIVKDEALAEEIVQEVFCRLWERNGKIHLQKATQPYLYKAVYNESMNVLKKAKYRSRHSTALEHETAAENLTDLKGLQEKANQALNELPEQCRTIFQMSRFEDLKYREIADRLGISVKTVEAQMSKALKILRSKLSDYLPAILVCIISLKK